MNKTITKRLYKALITLSVFIITTSCSEPHQSNWSRIDVNYGKPGAPVSLEYRVIGEAKADEQFEVQIIITSNTAAGSIEVKLNTEGAVELLSANLFVFDLADPNKSLMAKLLSPADELGYLNVNVYERDESGNSLNGRSFSIPLKIGSGDSAQRAKSAELNIVEDGDELIIELPAN